VKRLRDAFDKPFQGTKTVPRPITQSQLTSIQSHPALPLDPQETESDIMVSTDNRRIMAIYCPRNVQSSRAKKLEAGVWCTDAETGVGLCHGDQDIDIAVRIGIDAHKRTVSYKPGKVNKNGIKK
jgi:hypothetical protein